MWWLYNSSLWLGLLLSLPLRKWQPKIQYYLYYRLGRTLKQDCPVYLKRKKCVWFQALSVGEVLSVVPLVKGFCQHWPDVPIFFSASTMTGHKIAINQLKHTVAGIGYFPLDFPSNINYYLKMINPRVIVLIETDIWPNFLKITKEKEIPCLLLNARMSEHSYRRYKLIKSWFSEIINRLSFVGVQRQEDAERFLQLGVSPEKIKIMGNLKFDKPIPKMDETLVMQVKAELGISDYQPVWIAGSTHQGEEEVILKTHKAMLRFFPKLCLIIAPRHPERFDSVVQLAIDMGLRTKRRTENKEGEWEVIVLDTLGELARMYAVASFVFIGGSLVPIGGHNPLEAAIWGKPVIFGPFMFNFSEIAKQMLKEKAAIQVKEKELFNACRDFLEQPTLAHEMGGRGKTIVINNQGVVEGYLKVIERYL